MTAPNPDLTGFAAQALQAAQATARQYTSAQSSRTPRQARLDHEARESAWNTQQSTARAPQAGLVEPYDEQVTFAHVILARWASARATGQVLGTAESWSAQVRELGVDPEAAAAAADAGPRYPAWQDIEQIPAVIGRLTDDYTVESLYNHFAAARALQATRHANEWWSLDINGRIPVDLARDRRIDRHEQRFVDVDRARRAAGRDGSTVVEGRLSQVLARMRTDDLLARWAAAEATRAVDPDLADAWTDRLRESGVDPVAVRELAADLGGLPPDTGADAVAVIAADYTNLYRDQQLESFVRSRRAGADAANLIGAAFTPGAGVGTTDPAAATAPPPDQIERGLDHGAQL